MAALGSVLSSFVLALVVIGSLSLDIKMWQSHRQVTSSSSGWYGSVPLLIPLRAGPTTSLMDTFTQVRRQLHLSSSLFSSTTTPLYAVIQAIRGKGIWTSPVAAAILKVLPYSYNGYPAQFLNPQYYNYPFGLPDLGNTQPPPGGYSPALSGNAPLSPQPNYVPYPAANQGQILPAGGYQEQPHWDKSSYSSLKEVMVIFATEEVYALVHEKGGSSGGLMEYASCVGKSRMIEVGRHLLMMGW
ncbi:uncharacterized protein BJ212DRAFT_1303529 [Suillus subaureus]|uniref:Uncharacterized protein n=1 Tax=Suillus subaureus TaxID=48587 RepID=A0A9P7E089_9AGAM|nr:uncharacterized protein BJ212DRAFT_1303529 [Suillus subaureus]KAG1807313.1 hypothetical protein BJ212DRAFT_1303529 [Suillus subaureus]